MALLSASPASLLAAEPARAFEGQSAADFTRALDEVAGAAALAGDETESYAAVRAKRLEQYAVASKSAAARRKSASHLRPAGPVPLRDAELACLTGPGATTVPSAIQLDGTTRGASPRHFRPDPALCVGRANPPHIRGPGARYFAMRNGYVGGDSARACIAFARLPAAQSARQCDSSALLPFPSDGIVFALLFAVPPWRKLACGPVPPPIPVPGGIV